MNDAWPMIIANLKANKTWEEMVVWLDEVGKRLKDFAGTVIVCPTSGFIAGAAQKIRRSNYNIFMGSQDVSRFEQGPYTGEMAASQIASLCQYCLVGHSERRQNFGENDKVVASKFQNAKEAGLEPIVCVQNHQILIPASAKIVAYEPIFAIGTGKPDTPENAFAEAKLIKNKGDFMVIYGGSVISSNVSRFLKKGVIDGVLVGTNSLDPWDFIGIIEASL